MEVLNNLPELIVTALTAVFAVWGGAKLFFKKLWKALDEAEDVVSASADLMKEVADVPAAFVNLAEVKEDGSIVFKPENFEQLKKEVGEITAKIDNWKVQLSEAVAAIKSLFKKE